MSDGKVPLVEKWREPVASSTPSNEAVYNACADELEQFWPVIERLIAIGGAMSRTVTGYLGTGGLFNPEMMDAAKVRAIFIDFRNDWDREYAAYQAGRNGK